MVSQNVKETLWKKSNRNTMENSPEWNSTMENVDGIA